MFGLSKSSSESIACATVLITQSVRSASNRAQASINAGSISGSSPCTLTTMSLPSSPSRTQASASRSLPVAWSLRVSTHCTPCAAHAAAMSEWSAATTTAAAPDSAARCATRTIIGKPAMSASGLPGRRVDASRAGISAVKLTRRAAPPVRRAGLPRPARRLNAPRFRASRVCRRAPRTPADRGGTPVHGVRGTAGADVPAGLCRSGTPAGRAVAFPCVSPE